MDAQAHGADERLWDAVVVGGGPAGLAATLELGRCRRRTLLVDDARPRNGATPAIHGSLGWENVSPQRARERAWAHIARYPDVSRIEERIVRAWRETDELLAVQTGSGATIWARRLLLATGVEDICPDDVEAFAQYYGRSIHHCPYCDGYESRDRRIAVIAWGESAAPYALELLTWTREIRLLTHGHNDLPAEHLARLDAAHIPVDRRRLVRFEGDGERLSGIHCADGATIPCAAVFFYIGQRPRSELAAQLGCALITPEHPVQVGHVVVDRHQRTTVPDVFAAGDVAPPYETVSVAIAQGQIAAIEINRSLLDPVQRLT